MFVINNKKKDITTIQDLNTQVLYVQFIKQKIKEY